jgi:hypothetical protein
VLPINCEFATKPLALMGDGWGEEVQQSLTGSKLDSKMNTSNKKMSALNNSSFTETNNRKFSK